MQGFNINITLIFNLKFSLSRFMISEHVFLPLTSHMVATLPRHCVQIHCKSLESKDSIFCIFCILRTPS